jgi:Fic family protein
MFREHEIQPFSGGMKPPSWPMVDALMSEWVEMINGTTAQLRARGTDEPLPEVLARLHNRFERVHPFIDGNGRAGRLILNLILVRLGYPPVIILKKQRDAYLGSMQRADHGDYGPLGEILARAMYDNLNRFIVPNVAGPARLVPLAALVIDDGLTRAAGEAGRRAGGRRDLEEQSQSR